MWPKFPRNPNHWRSYEEQGFCGKISIDHWTLALSEAAVSVQMYGVALAKEVGAEHMQVYFQRGLDLVS